MFEILAKIIFISHCVIISLLFHYYAVLVIDVDLYI